MHIIEKALLDAYDGFTTTANGGKNRIVRCPECGDSEKLDHAHLSITRNYPFLYKCFRCNWSGAVNADFLKMFDVEITPEIEAALKQNRQAVKVSAAEHSEIRKGNIKSIVKGLSSQLAIPQLVDEDRKSIGVRYTLERFNADFSNEELEKFRVIPDLRKFWKFNRLVSLPGKMKKEDMACLADNYAIFADSGCHGLICRSTIDDEDLERYQEVRFQKNSERLYCFKTKLDLTDVGLKLVLAEGIFDLIGIWNKFPKLREDYTFVACLGKSPAKVIEFFTELGFLDQKILIFADNDVEDGYIIKELKELKFPKILGYDITIFRNTLGKDFGVKAEEIKSTYRVLRSKYL